MTDAREMVDQAADGFARLSPAARRFAAGTMPNCEAARLGYTRRDPDHECELCRYVDCGW